ncbi:MAG: MBL fold metallo-hydrolase [Myxococcaceae bacterium]
MSEAIAGMPKMPSAVAKTRDASAVILFRRLGGEVEVFWLKREKNLTFAGGYYAFPGGKLDAADANVPVEGATGPDGALKAAAARELFEETGVLVANGAEKLSKEKVAELRKALLDKKVAFRELLEKNGLSVKAADFKDAGRWVTPPFLPVRFDARFYLVEAPKNANAEFWPGELAEGAWVKPKEALKRWEEGTALLHPPNLHALQTMASFTTVEAALHQLQNPVHVPNFIASRIEFQRGFRIFPLETDTLPPATHTNAYVLGNGELLIVDPGASEVRQYARLLALIAGLKAEGKRAKAVFLTHHHADHVSAAAAVAERLNVPIWCHEQRCSAVSGNASRSAFQNPSAPSTHRYT